MKIYISGKISGVDRTKYEDKFRYAAQRLRDRGHKVINPVYMCAGLARDGFTYDDLMQIDIAALEVCDAVYMLADWKESPGARREHERAEELGLEIIYQEEEREEIRRRLYGGV